MPTGVAIALPSGYAAFVHPRSGLAARHGVTIVNAPGTVDAGYRGEIHVNLVNLDPSEPFTVRRGDRIAQLVVQQVAGPSSSRWTRSRTAIGGTLDTEPAGVSAPAGPLPAQQTDRGRTVSIFRRKRRTEPTGDADPRTRRRRGLRRPGTRGRPRPLADAGRCRQPSDPTAGCRRGARPTARVPRPRSVRPLRGGRGRGPARPRSPVAPRRPRHGAAAGGRPGGPGGRCAAVLGGSAVQLQAFAAPRTEGLWPDIRSEIAASITRQGGTAEDVAGPLGSELQTRMPEAAVADVRFIGVDGPRWFLRAVLSGRPRSTPRPPTRLIDVVRSTVVVRGDEPMAPRDLLPLQLPRPTSCPQPDEDVHRGAPHRRPVAVRARPRDHRDPLSGQPPSTVSKPGLRERLAGRLIRTEAELEADELQDRSDRLGGTPIALASSEASHVCGAVRSVTLRPRSTCPPWSSSSTTAPSRIHLVWLGRRPIGGIEPGTYLRPAAG